MTLDEVRAVVQHYREEYGTLVPSAKAPDLLSMQEVSISQAGPVLAAHLAYMLAEMEKMCEAFDKAGTSDDRHDKLMRWLGFVQGLLWATGLKTLHTLKADNKSSSTEVASE